MHIRLVDHIPVVDDQDGNEEPGNFGRTVKGTEKRANRSEKGRMTLGLLVYLHAMI